MVHLSLRVVNPAAVSLTQTFLLRSWLTLVAVTRQGTVICTMQRGSSPGQYQVLLTITIGLSCVILSIRQGMLSVRFTLGHVTSGTSSASSPAMLGSMSLVYIPYNDIIVQVLKWTQRKQDQKVYRCDLKMFRFYRCLDVSSFKKYVFKRYFEKKCLKNWVEYT